MLRNDQANVETTAQVRTDENGVTFVALDAGANFDFAEIAVLNVDTKTGIGMSF